MIVQRGFPPPPDYPRLLNAPVQHFFDVITHGYGAMYSYAKFEFQRETAGPSLRISARSSSRATGRSMTCPLSSGPR